MESERKVFTDDQMPIASGGLDDLTLEDETSNARSSFSSEVKHRSSPGRRER
jgi:hypothetical protein